MTKQTKQELLVVARELKIKGRHEMTVLQLEAAVQQTKSFKAETKFVRKGQNPSGNKPYAGKAYSVQRINQAAFKEASPQVQAIVTFMCETGIQARGGDVIKAAVKAGKLKTRCKDPRVLFGYLAKDLQKVGATSRYEHS